MNRKAFTLVEVIVAIALGSFILLLTGLAIVNASKILGKTSGRDQCFRDLARARISLEPDLTALSLSHYTVAKAPSSLGGAGGADGDVIDMLTAVNVTDGKIVPVEDGSGQPYYFLNLVYYITTPSNHDTLFGQSCMSGNDGGYDYNCPHKILMRAVEDENPVFDPPNKVEDQLLPALSAACTRPVGFPKTPDRRSVAAGLLSFQVKPLPGELEITLKAVSIPDARRKVGIGSTNLRQGPYTVEQRFSVFPKN